MANFKAVGQIEGSPLNGLCERMCINVDCVIDACRSRREGQTATVVLNNFSAGATPPFTYSAAYPTGGSTFRVTGVRQGSTCPCRSVSGVLEIPISVSFVDANGNNGFADGVISVQRDIALRVPDGNNVDYRFDGEAVIICMSGGFISDNTVNITYCMVETFRTLVRADILVPTYGFAVYPECRQCNGCNRLIDLPVFPET